MSRASEGKDIFIGSAILYYKSLYKSKLRQANELDIVEKIDSSEEAIETLITSIISMLSFVYRASFDKSFMLLITLNLAQKQIDKVISGEITSRDKLIFPTIIFKSEVVEGEPIIISVNPLALDALVKGIRDHSLYPDKGKIEEFVRSQDEARDLSIPDFTGEAHPDLTGEGSDAGAGS